jgi:hypothetical protein
MICNVRQIEIRVVVGHSAPLRIQAGQRVHRARGRDRSAHAGHLLKNATRTPCVTTSRGSLLECLEHVETEPPERRRDVRLVTPEIRRLNSVTWIGKIPSELDNRLSVHHPRTDSKPVLDRGIRAGLLKQLFPIRCNRLIKGDSDVFALELCCRIPASSLTAHSQILPRVIRSVTPRQSDQLIRLDRRFGRQSPLP